MKGTFSSFQSFWDSKAGTFLCGSEMKFCNQLAWEVNQYCKLRLVDVQWWPAASWIQLNYRCINRDKRCYGNSRSRLLPCKVKFKVARQSPSPRPLKPAYSRSVPLLSTVNCRLLSFTKQQVFTMCLKIVTSVQNDLIHTVFLK